MGSGIEFEQINGRLQMQSLQISLQTESANYLPPPGKSNVPAAAAIVGSTFPGDLVIATAVRLLNARPRLLYRRF